MKPPPFDYHRPETLDGALALLAEHGDGAKILAGGQSLIPAMNFRLAMPGILIDINRLAELDHITPADDGGVRIGAMTRQASVEASELVAERAPLLAETMPHIAHPQIRNRGTIGGNLAHADPASELPAVMTALGARLRAVKTGGERWIPVGEFFGGMMTTALEADELLAEIHIPPMAAGAGHAFLEAARRHGDYALLGLAAIVTRDGASCTSAKIVYFSAGDGPVEAPAAAAALVNQPVGEAAIAAAAEAAATTDITDPPGDLHATPAFRRHLARGLTQRALATAFERAQR